MRGKERYEMFKKINYSLELHRHYQGTVQFALGVYFEKIRVFKAGRPGLTNYSVIQKMLTS